jgi:hypothetical protein
MVSIISVVYCLIAGIAAFVLAGTVLGWMLGKHMYVFRLSIMYGMIVGLIMGVFLIAMGLKPVRFEVASIFMSVALLVIVVCWLVAITLERKA